MMVKTGRSTNGKHYMRSPHTINFALQLLLVIVIEMAAFFYFSAEPGIFATPAFIRSQSHSSRAQHPDEHELRVQLAILGYDFNNIPFVKESVENSPGICELRDNLLLSYVICPSILCEKFDDTIQRIAIRNSSGVPSMWNSSIPIANRQLLI